MRAIDRSIEVKVRGWHLTKDNRNAGVQYEANVSFLRIDFDDGWDSYAKTVTFWDALMGNPVKRVLTTDLLEDIFASTRVYIVPIPGEAMGEAGGMTFVIDGLIDGKRKRSLSDTLWVKEAPIEEEAGEPVDPTPSQAEQLQTQIDSIKDTIQSAVNAGSEALSYAEFARDQANTAQDAALYSQNWSNQANKHREDAAASAEAAAKYASEAHEAAGGDFATPTEAKRYASEAQEAANKYTDEKIAAIPTPDVSGQIGSHNTDQEAHSDIRELASSRLEKSGGSMTGILTFETPTLFSAFQKKRTIGGVNYIMRAGIGNDGGGASVCLRLFSVAADGTETVVSHIEADRSGIYWVAPGGIRKTVAHSGNIGVLTASVE